MISTKVLNELYEIYLDFGLEGLRQEIKDRKLHKKAGVTVTQIVQLVQDHREV